MQMHCISTTNLLLQICQMANIHDSRPPTSKEQSVGMYEVRLYNRSLDRYVGKQAGRQAGRQESRKTGRQADRQEGRQAGGQAGRQVTFEFIL